MKVLYFDLETTGVKFWKNSIHQISGLIEIDGEIKETFDLKTQPFHAAEIEDESLKVAGINRETLKTYNTFNNTYKSFVEMISKYVDKFNRQDKFFLIGYNNASFDNNFLRGFFAQNADNYFGSWFWSNSIDVMVLAAEYLKDVRHLMTDFKLKTVAAHVGINVEESRLHDAIYDIELTMKIYKIVTNK